jgi:hypothetical protein
MNLEGDDGTRPANGTLLTARYVDGKIRILLERVRRRGQSWEAWSPITFRDYDAWDAIPEEDVRALGESVLLNLRGLMTEAK